MSNEGILKGKGRYLPSSKSKKIIDQLEEWNEVSKDYGTKIKKPSEPKDAPVREVEHQLERQDGKLK